MNNIPDYLSIVTDVVSEELLNADMTLNSDVVEYLLMIQYSGVKLETFFSPPSLVHIPTEVFGNVKYRDFILGVVQRLAVRLDESDVSTLINIITDSYKHYNECSLVPSELRQNIRVDIDSIREILSQNFWLLVYYLLILIKGNIHGILKELR